MGRSLLSACDGDDGRLSRDVRSIGSSGAEVSDRPDHQHPRSTFGLSPARRVSRIGAFFRGDRRRWRVGRTGQA